jgi:hypothetical protein
MGKGGGIILTWTLNKYGARLCTWLIWFRGQGSVGRSCEHGNESPGSIEGDGRFLDQLSDCYVLKDTGACSWFRLVRIMHFRVHAYNVIFIPWNHMPKVIIFERKLTPAFDKKGFLSKRDKTAVCWVLSLSCYVPSGVKRIQNKAFHNSHFFTKRTNFFFPVTFS